jgi:uncharacterized protein
VRLFVDGQDVGVLSVAASPSERRRGLLGIDSFDGAMWFPGIKSVHTFGMRFAIDVAYIDDSGKVTRIQTMRPGRLGPWVRRAAGILEAEGGQFEHWALRAGSLVSYDDRPFGLAPLATRSIIV